LTLESKAARLEDPGARLLDAMASAWARYGRVAMIALGVAAVIGVGVFFTYRTRAAAEEQAAAQLAEANLFFWRGDYARSLQMARQVAEQWPASPSGVDARRLAGDSQFWAGSFKEAAAVRRSLAYALESDHQFKEAAAVYEGLVGKFDRGSSAEFLYATARCYRALNQPREADQRLQRLLDEYGETPDANRARILRAELAGAAR
jgi:tetratricopeptide (TPR) repeat protein